MSKTFAVIRNIRNWMRGVGAIVYLLSSAAWAHDPIFGIGPHVLFKNGFKVGAACTKLGRSQRNVNC